MKNIPATSLNIAIIPDESTQNLAISMSRKVHKEAGSYFILNKLNLLPHITITRIRKAEDGKKALQMLENQKASFNVGKLIIGYLGDHGTVNEITERIPLKFI